MLNNMPLLYLFLYCKRSNFDNRFSKLIFNFRLNQIDPVNP
jgi:hypothetical protein